jgi:hypothetical protein
MKSIKEAISEGPERQWFQVEDSRWDMKNIWYWRDGETVIQIGPNVSADGKVIEYGSDVQRGCNGVNIKGTSWFGSDLETIKSNCEREAHYLNSIKVPARQE